MLFPKLEQYVFRNDPHGGSIIIISRNGKKVLLGMAEVKEEKL